MEKSKFNINLSVNDIVGGGFVEKLETEFQKVFENIHDPNTEAKDKRVVTAKFTFAPDDTRELVDLSIDLTTKTAPHKGLQTRVITDKDLVTNTIVAQEFMSNQRGQTFIDDDGQLRTDTGEPVDVIEKEMTEKQEIQNNIRELKRGSK